MSRLSVTAVASSASSSSLHPHPQHQQDALWQMNLKPYEQVDYGPYPVREGEPDCTFYIRTGLCRFGSTCRFNHPPNRKLAIATARMNGEYPERLGQAECQYYLKTGTCKFGGTCKFHHPRDRAGIAGAVPLNSLGYPLRPNEMDCSYYMRNGHCKFGSTCKFNHPQPQNMMVSLRGSALYPQPVQSPNAGQLSYPLSRASFIANPQWQNPSTNYAPMVVPQGMVSVLGWDAYSGQVGSAMLSADQSQLLSTAATSRNISGLNLDGEVVNQLNNLGVSVPMGYYVFPERPGQPECQFYMKTGDCKFGAVCKFHHPRDRQAPPPDSALSQLGLPLRPGEPICVFYSRYGICKFGPSCKFDHPMNIFGLLNNNNKNTAIVVAAAAAASSSPSDFHRLLEASTASAGGVGLSFGQEARVQKPSGESNVGSESM